MRVTAFLGAGIYLDIDKELSTEDLTNLVRKKEQQFIDPFTRQKRDSFFIDEVASKLNSYFVSKTCNFEELFHVLETMSSYFRGSQSHTGKEYKPPFGAFIKPNYDQWLNDQGEDAYLLSLAKLITAKRDILNVVADRIFELMKKLDQTHEHSWFASFWNNAINSCRWDIATLNYDNCIEKSIRNKAIEDGYEIERQGLYRFNPKKLILSESSKILHLHGCILYGTAHYNDPNKYLFEDAFEDVYKFDSYKDAKMTWFGKTANNSQSREEAIAGPIIIGLRKTDKLLHYPYSVYNFVLQQALFQNSRLLIAGYSFSDLHFNAMLERVVRLHGANRRVVIIDSWHSDMQVMGRPVGNMYECIAGIFCNRLLFKSNKFQSPIISEDGCVRLYLRGMKDALENHEKEILSFLAS